MFLDEYIQRVIDSRAALVNYAPAPVETIPQTSPDSRRATYELQWGEGTIPQPQPLTVPESREHVISELRRYYDKGASDEICLLTPDPGQGKSTTAIRFAQELAMRGKRVLYLMPRHDYWKDIVKNPFTKQNLWHHWLSVDGVRDGEPMCRFATSAKAWTGKGYKLIDHCKALCSDDGHMSECSYRAQRRTTRRIIAGVHNHLSTGLAITDFDVVFVDELPIGAFVDERYIPAKFLDVGARGRVKELIDRIVETCHKAPLGKELRGVELMSAIADSLPAIYDNMSLAAQWLPQLPDVTQPEQVFTVKEWYIYDLLLLLLPEYYAYKAGRQNWLSRVGVTRGGLKLRQKKELWAKLPGKIIVMDGTGDSEVYGMLFSRKVFLINPVVQRTGRIFQITERAFNISAVAEQNGDLTGSGSDLLELSRLIAQSKPLPGGGFGSYERVGVVTFKKIRRHFDMVYGEENVLHFGGNRGTNAFVGKDCVMVLGTPSPPDEAMIDLMAQLSFNTKEPHKSEIEAYLPTQNERGFIPVRSVREVEYTYASPDGLVPSRAISGFWEHPKLHAVYAMFREGEIKQSGHRGRPLTMPCDVWLITSIPIKERLDGIWNSPNDCLNLPREVHWSRWPALKRWLYQEELFVSVNDIAEKEKVSRQWAAKWAKSIADWQPHVWQFSTDPNASGMGRPQSGLLRIA